MFNVTKNKVNVVLLLTVAISALSFSDVAAAASPKQKSDGTAPVAEAQKKPEAVEEKKVEAAKPAPAVPAPAQGRFDISQGFSAIAEKVVPTVVNVSTTQIVEGREKGNLPQFAPGSPFEDLFKDFLDQMERPRRVQSLGSGFIVQNVEKDGESYILVATNYHVIADASKISIFLHDNTELEAVRHSYDERTDIALIKVKTDGLPPAKRQMPTIEWGDSNNAKVGDWVLAIGNPFGLGSTVTSGIISNRSRDIGMRSNSRSRISEYVDDFMQHDASINMGNSGGPLFNLEGKVVGINTAIFSPSGGNVGIGFAIPSALASETIKQLIEFGRTKRGWLGVRIQNVSDDMAESFGLGKAHGAIVGGVTPKGPAASASIEPGDIILEFDGKVINEKTKLSRVVGETEVGKKVKVKLWRKGKEILVDVVLGEFETSTDNAVVDKASKTEKASAPDLTEILGMKVSKITGPLSQQFQLVENAKGVVIVSLQPESLAATSGIRSGDVIEEANQIEVVSPEGLSKQVEEAKSNKRRNITFLINRRGEKSFVTVKLYDDLKTDGKEEPKKEESKPKSVK